VLGPNTGEQLVISLIARDHVNAGPEVHVRRCEIDPNDRRVGKRVAPHRERIPLPHAELEQARAAVSEPSQQLFVDRQVGGRFDDLILLGTLWKLQPARGTHRLRIDV
jgi:hypothetical protein